MALLIGSYTATWTITAATSKEMVQALVVAHRSFGVAIPCLTAARFAIRLASPIPSLPPDIPHAQRLAAKLTVLALYSLLLLQPLLGLAGSMLHGDRIALVGGLVLPAILPVDRDLSDAVFQIHGTVALLLLALVAMHVAAALYHHFVRRDDVLAGMLPRLHRASRTGQDRRPRRVEPSAP